MCFPFYKLLLSCSNMFNYNILPFRSRNEPRLIYKYFDSILPLISMVFSKGQINIECKCKTSTSRNIDIWIISLGLSLKNTNSILAGCLQLKFPKVFVRNFIYKINSAIKIRGHGHQCSIINIRSLVVLEKHHPLKRYNRE